MFKKSYHVTKTKDDASSLKKKGTRIISLVTNVEKDKDKYRVVCSPEEDQPYADRIFYSDWSVVKPKVRINGKVDLYVDEMDCDGEYFVDIPNEL